MNTTTTNHELDDTNPIIIYIMIAVEIINAIINFLMAYKLDHLKFNASHVECCGCIFDDIYIDTDEDNMSKSK